jgi:Tol biopolymer transport system component
MIGQTLSHYRIVEKLGGGGMGVVYRAEDTRLKRPVALKVLPPELTRDGEAKQRFIVEAQAASALDHPNICTIFEIDETPDGQLFLVMAYYPGETLKKRIDRGPLALEDALDFAVQIAQGLVKAHGVGIIHRDIKPANVIVTADGLLKIVDFGVAKLLGNTGMTRTGTALGTVAYMAPEQTMGKDVDARADVWSLGVVLYEMIAGQLPFKGEHDLAVASAVVNRPPTPLTSVRTGIPPAIERIVNRALEKAPEDRYQTAADFLSELRLLKRNSETQFATVTQTVQSPTRRRLPWIAASIVVAAVATAALAYLAAGRNDPGGGLPRLINPRLVAGSTDVEIYPVWSPDSRMLAYQMATATNVDIWITQVDGGPPINRTADHQGPDIAPSWSPDGRQIAFYSNRDGFGVFVMPALAGAARKVAETPIAGSTWSRDSSELAYVISDAGVYWLEVRRLAEGTSRRLALPGRIGNQRLDLRWSPDNRFILYVDARNTTAQVTQILVLRLSDGKAIPLTDGMRMEWTPTWSPDSRTIYFTSNRGGVPDLWRQRIADDGMPAGSAEQISFGLGVITAAVSPDGTKIAYDRGRGVGNAWRVPILPDRPATWADAQQLTFDNALVEFLDVSPDGTRLVVSSDRRGNPDLWILPAAGGEMQQFTTDPTPEWDPRWSPNGRELAFYAYRSGNREIWAQAVAGGPARQLTKGESESAFAEWAPDGRHVVYNSRSNGPTDVWTVSAAGGQATMLVGDKIFEEGDPMWSRDGEWIFFRSNRSGTGRADLWRISPSGGRPEVIVPAIGGAPYLSRDGRSVLSISPPNPPHDRALLIASIDGKSARPLTALTGRRGFIHANALSTDDKFVYFTWEDGVSDVWVMDIAR